MGRQVRPTARDVWERDNADKFTDDFAATQNAGVSRHGMRFICAQEAAMTAGFNGIFRPFEYSNPVAKAQLSRIVLAVLDNMATKRHAVSVGDDAA